MVAGDAFEDVLYGSESELGDSDDDEGASHLDHPKKRKGGARLRVDDDEPMDLLSGAASRVTRAFHGCFRQVCDANGYVSQRPKEGSNGNLEMRHLSLRPTMILEK